MAHFFIPEYRADKSLDEKSASEKEISELPIQAGVATSFGIHGGGGDGSALDVWVYRGNNIVNKGDLPPVQLRLVWNFPGKHIQVYSANGLMHGDELYGMLKNGHRYTGAVSVKGQTVPASDFLLFFSGVQIPTTADLTLGGTEVKENQQGIFEAMKQIPKRNEISNRRDLGWFGSIVKTEGITAAFNTIVTSEDYQPPKSKLIIYGYSAGGENALKLCQRFDEHNAKAGTKKVTVDLLVTVDAAAGERTKFIKREVGDCVKKNINFFNNDLDVDKENRSHGEPNSGKCNPDNRKRPFSHKDMQEKTMTEALDELRDGFGVKPKNK